MKKYGFLDNLEKREEKEMTEVNTKKRFLLEQLKNMDEVFVLFSRCTRMPYIQCDEESFDDQIYIFRREENALETAKEFQEAKIPVQVVKFPKENFLTFYSSLYFIGVNAMVVDKGEDEMRIQVRELVIPPDYSNLPEGKVRVDNPQFQLTAIYLMQMLRREKGVKPNQEMKEMEEEMIANMRKGTFIVPVQDDKQVPLVKLSDENMFQPVCSDIGEFNKFNRDKNFRPAVVPFAKLHEVVVPQAKGIVINPLGVHVVLMKEQLK